MNVFTPKIVSSIYNNKGTYSLHNNIDDILCHLYSILKQSSVNLPKRIVYPIEQESLFIHELEDEICGYISPEYSYEYKRLQNSVSDSEIKRGLKSFLKKMREDQCGYIRISGGRGPFGFIKAKNAFYIVDFKDSQILRAEIPITIVRWMAETKGIETTYNGTYLKMTPARIVTETIPEMLFSPHMEEKEEEGEEEEEVQEETTDDTTNEGDKKLTEIIKIEEKEPPKKKRRKRVTKKRKKKRNDVRQKKKRKKSTSSDSKNQEESDPI